MIHAGSEPQGQQFRNVLRLPKVAGAQGQGDFSPIAAG
jgi:hypothetical protein